MGNVRYGIRNIDGNFLGGKDKLNEKPIWMEHCQEWEWFTFRKK